MLQKCKELDEAGRKVQMHGWQSERRFNSDLAINISLLVFGCMVACALLTYRAYVYAP